MKTLLVGMGNPILCDDAVGVRLATDFSQRLGKARIDIDVVEECSVGGLNLIDVLRGYERVLLLDSIQTQGGKPGAWYTFDGTYLQDTLHLTNIHDANFATAIELGRRLGVPLPAPHDIHIFAIEVADNITFGTCMTPALEGAYPAYSEAIYAEITAMLRRQQKLQTRERLDTRERCRV